MKILSVATFAHPEAFGGAERVVSTVAAGLAARGHDVTLLTSRLEGAPQQELRAGVRVVRYDIDRSSTPAFYRSVWRGVRAALRLGIGAGADVMHVHQVASAVAAVTPGAWARRPTLFSFYAPYHLEYLARHRDGHARGTAPWPQRAVARVLRHADRRLLSRSQAVVVLSRFSLAQVAELCPQAVARTVVAPAGVDLERFRPAGTPHERASSRAAVGLEDDDVPWLLTVRRLVPRMGIGDLLEACALLVRRGVRFRLAIAGDGEQRADLEARTEALGLGARVRFLGRVGDDRLGDLYRAASLFVLPTRSLEGFGMVTAEALASGLPVVATDVGATPEVLQGATACRQVPAGSPDALAAAIAGVLGAGGPSGGQEALAAAGRALRAHAARHFSWTPHLEALEQAAERIAGAGG